MIQIYGKVDGADLMSGESKSFNECLNDCYQNEDCILVFMNFDGKCLSFDFSSTQNLTVIETTKEDRLSVAFKAKSSSDQCPVYDEIELEVTLGEDPLSWKRTDVGWTFKKCFSDWKMFIRNETVTVCMQTFVTSGVAVQNDAKIKCDELGGYKLSGIASFQELEWVQKRRDTIVMWERYMGFWIDGVRNPTYSGKLNDLHFEMSDGYSQFNETLFATYGSYSGSGGGWKEDCLVVCNPEPGLFINDDNCNRSTSAFGYVCGYQFF